VKREFLIAGREKPAGIGKRRWGRQGRERVSAMAVANLEAQPAVEPFVGVCWLTADCEFDVLVLSDVTKCTLYQHPGHHDSRILNHAGSNPNLCEIAHLSFFLAV